MNEYINPAIGTLILLSIGLTVLYLQGRIKNLATKHDVGDLTRITEEIKNKFKVDSEHVIHLKKLEIEAVINYNSTASEFIASLYSIEISEFNEDNYSELKNAKKEILALDRKLNSAYFHLQLFFDDENSRKIMSDFDGRIIEFSDSLNRSIEDLNTRYSKLAKYVEQIHDSFNPTISQAISQERMSISMDNAKMNKVLEEKIKSLVSSRNIFTKHAIERIRNI